MTTWTELARVTVDDRTFLLQESSDKAIGVRTDDDALGTFGALLSRAGDGWRVQLVAPVKYRTERAWKKVSAVPATSFPDLARAVAAEVLTTLDLMRFLDPVVVGDPVEDKAPAPVKAKLSKLRRRVAELERAVVEARAEAANVLAPLELSDTFLVQPVARHVGLGTGPSVEFAAFTGVIRGELVSGELIVDTSDGQLAVIPNARNSVTVRVVPRQERP